jgi:hypothetical protein
MFIDSILQDHGSPKGVSRIDPRHLEYIAYAALVLLV